jgi:hypothetical protein
MIAEKAPLLLFKNFGDDSQMSSINDKERFDAYMKLKRRVPTFLF